VEAAQHRDVAAQTISTRNLQNGTTEAGERSSNEKYQDALQDQEQYQACLEVTLDTLDRFFPWLWLQSEGPCGRCGWMTGKLQRKRELAAMQSI
jgi:hypothetical protein